MRTRTKLDALKTTWILIPKATKEFLATFIGFWILTLAALATEL